MKKIGLLLISSLFIIGCGSNPDINMTELDKIIVEDNYVIIDVRTKEEYEEGHLVDAINIPYDTIDEEINIEKDKTIMVYCKSGARSKIAYDTLSTLGYKVYDLGAYEEIDLPKE